MVLFSFVLRFSLAPESVGIRVVDGGGSYDEEGRVVVCPRFPDSGASFGTPDLSSSEVGPDLHLEDLSPLSRKWDIRFPF